MKRPFRAFVLVAIFLRISYNLLHQGHYMSSYRNLFVGNRTLTLRHFYRPAVSEAVRNAERFSALPRCPIPYQNPTWEYYDALVRQNSDIAEHARRATEDPPNRTKREEPARIPHLLIFTHKDDLFECSQSASNSTPPELHTLAENAKATVDSYSRIWPDLEYVFLTNNDCIDALNETEPGLIPWFNNINLAGMYKADLCRAAFLFLNGGYYFDVDIVTVRPFVPPPDVAFVTVRGNGFPKDGFFQAFLAAEKGSAIVRRSLVLMLEALRGERPKGKYLGPTALMGAWMEAENVTNALDVKPDNTDVYLLTEVALDVASSITKCMKLANVLATKDGFGMYQHVPSGQGDHCQFSAGACNFVVVDELDETLYFYSRALGTSWCGKRLRENGECSTEEILMERIWQSEQH